MTRDREPTAGADPGELTLDPGDWESFSRTTRADLDALVQAVLDQGAGSSNG